MSPKKTKEKLAATMFTAGKRWDKGLVKKLLQYPSPLLYEEPWRTWIAGRGGLDAVYAQLLSQPLTSAAHKLLALRLERPGETAQFYAQELGLSPSTYFERLSQLLAALAAGLNEWDGAQAQREVAEPPAQPRMVAAGALPTELTSFFGREAELTTITRLLQTDARLLTLTGPGGTGKTRLALRAATRLIEAFTEGVRFVPLAPIVEPSLVIPTIAHTLGMHEVSSHDLLDDLKLLLHNKHLLLVLDNFEQILEAAPLLVELLHAAPLLKLLVTSRARLQVSSEHEFIVRPFPTAELKGPPGEQLQRPATAVALFVERGRQVKTDFALDEHNAHAIGAICAQLDGLPLAIELAAARLKFFSPETMLAQLQSSRLQSLTGGGRDRPSRQQTLRNTIEWSYVLLENVEQLIFRRLGIFAGGCTTEAAAAVCDLDGDLRVDPLEGLLSLVDKSMLSLAPGPDATPRVSMLETIREYALGQLADSGEVARIARQHALFYLGLAEGEEQDLRGREARAWLERLERDHDNLRAALRWSLEQDDMELCARLCGALSRFWYARGYFTEGRQWLELVLSKPVPADARGKLLHALTRLVWAQGDAPLRLLEESIELYRAQGDVPGLGMALCDLSMVMLSQCMFETAREFAEEGLAVCRGIAYRPGMARALSMLGFILLYQSEAARAYPLFAESLELYQALALEDGISFARHGLTWAALSLGSGSEAQAHAQEALRLCQALGHRRGLGASLSALSWIALVTGDAAAAWRWGVQALEHFQATGSRDGIAEVLEGLGFVAGRRRQPGQAVRLWGAAAQLRQELGASLPPLDQARYAELRAAIEALLDPALVAQAQAALGPDTLARVLQELS